MRLLFKIACIGLLLCQTLAQEKSDWTWGEDAEDEFTKQLSPVEEIEPSASGFVEQQVQVLNDTEVEEVVDTILTSTRQGRNLEGYDEVYSDPSLHDAIQKGDDGEARNIIKDRLCSLGLMQCEGSEGKRPYISPEELIYAQPVAINPVGRPIPTIPVKGPVRTYGPPRPMPFPHGGGSKYPPGKFGPPGGPHGGSFIGGPPGPRPGYPPKPVYPGPHGKPTLHGSSTFEKPYFGGEKPFLNGPGKFEKPFLNGPGPFGGPGQFGGPGPIPNRPPPPFKKPYPEQPSLDFEGASPYEFDRGFINEYQGSQKEKVVINGAGNGGLQQHVHHHFHHGDGAKVPGSGNGLLTGASTIGGAVVASNFGSASTNSFGSVNSGFTSGNQGFTSGNQGFTSGNQGLTAANQLFSAANQGFSPVNPGFGPSSAGFNNYKENGLTGGTYGGQTLPNYGSSSAQFTGLGSFGTRPVVENQGPQTFSSPGLYSSNSLGASVGSYGNSGLYKKELELSGNSIQNNFLQSNYASGNKYQDLVSPRGENYDCICVPYDQCPSHEVIGRKDDLYLALDPRNLKSDIQAEEERVITDGNGTMTTIRVAKDAVLNATSLEEVKKEQESTTDGAKKISKREAPEEKNTKLTDDKPEARQNNYNNNNNNLYNKIKPTFGVSFGLPHQGGGGYPINPYGPNPHVNPYGHSFGGHGGINLGLVSVNPLVSVQLSKNDYGEKIVKPFVNLHVTPNNFLLGKFHDFFAYKKGAFLNKHHHYHHYKPPHYPHFRPPYYGPHGPPIHEGPYREGPEFGHGGPGHYAPHFEHAGPAYAPHFDHVGPPHAPHFDHAGPPHAPHFDHAGPPHAPHFEHEGPIYDKPHFEQPHFGHFDEPIAGGGYGDGGFFGRSYNDTKIVKGNRLAKQYQQQYDKGANTYGYGQYFYGNQQNGIGNQQNALGNQQNIFGNQQNVLGNQQNAFGNEQNAFGNQQNAFGNQQNAYGNQNGYVDQNGYADPNGYTEQNGYPSANAYNPSYYTNQNQIQNNQYTNQNQQQISFGANNDYQDYDQNQNVGAQNFDEYDQNISNSRGGKSLKTSNPSLGKSSNPVKFPTSRRRRDVTASANDSSNDASSNYSSSKDSSPSDSASNDSEARVGKRQAFYQQGRPQACGPRHVCCKRPLRPQVPHVPQGLHQQCGTRHSQGINGRIKNPVYVDGDSEFGEYPWQVAILKKDPKESVYVCGGTLIDALHIITAAHCIKTYTNFDLRVRLGEWDVNHDVEFYPYIERDISSVNVHPEFYAGTLYNDIAIIRMDKPVDFSRQPHISPACLPNLADDYAGTRCWTTGWGKDAFGEFGKYQNILKEVDVPVVGHAQCQQQLRQTRLGYDFKLHPGFVCAGGEEGKDACKGDGGGPMVCERGGSWQIVGVVSWGIGCGQYGVPGVYVKVAHYLDWIRQVVQRY